ncbi:hypothetical protein MnTg02_03395 [bacterium MnTg02]|nr:hypothetical protein MnTg02_03395 [bacterium MnTg02]
MALREVGSAQETEQNHFIKTYTAYYLTGLGMPEEW